MAGSTFNGDVVLAEKVSRFLNGIIYPQLDFVKIYKAYEWDRNKKKQMNGIDVDMELANGTTLKVDEKGAFHYMKTEGCLNQGLPTFSFELGYVKNGEIKKGWLVDEHKTTDAYLLMWATTSEDYANMNKYKPIKRNFFLKAFTPKIDLKEIEFMLVSRNMLKKCLKDMGMDYATLYSYAQYIIQNNAERGGSISIDKYENVFPFSLTDKQKIIAKENNNMRFYASKGGYAEQPVNLVIKKDFMLRDLENDKLANDESVVLEHFVVERNEKGEWKPAKITWL